MDEWMGCRHLRGDRSHWEGISIHSILFFSAPVESNGTALSTDWEDVKNKLKEPLATTNYVEV
jgi:hypothetical protein